ncbi:glycoside hydrolase family 3 C-terminal domain-containing protein [Butyrivibrio sp.]|uniref:glycoside hydrolase family 3 C-terminal domain-containing protein n=1 Tax=Butyrivibrio sp. TaxID=28121 RepID=UPI0025C09B21|nr:glycoside hydrolase family 3 C-terminal domain-containing protein [Butyrivibrio sp.]MBQ9305977.1 glycoside hydrolase family 3 C-terminal domain-containing protein [Butyrivibrio sp.]
MKHQDIIEKMTIEEKAAFLSGKGEWQTRDFERLGIPSIFCSDGPHGIRKQAGAGDHLGLNASLPATCFPTAATIANSWNTELGETLGETLGEEAMAEGVNVLLGPGLNIKRSPLCGRNFEYFSEDPYLAGKMAASYVRGIQSQGVYACPKHFAVNSQELRRMAMNSVVDERTLREIYLTGFEIAVKEGGAKTIMSAYNEINGTYANENKHLLNDILRKEWGFDGIVITDWGASNDHALGVAAGSNLEMPNPGLDSARELIAAVESGKISIEDVDARVDELLDAVMTLYVNAQGKSDEFDKNAHHNVARRAAAESTILLKNEGGILPLKAGAKVAIVGDFAFVPRYQGAGSSLVNPTKIETVAELIGTYDLQVVGMSRGYSRNGQEDATVRKEALDMAAKADIVLYFFGLNEDSESEGMDRTHMRIPQNQINLLQELGQVNPNLVGIISAGSAIEMPWHHYFKALLHCYLNGQAGAGAVMDILTGDVNPSGKLSETIPRRLEDTPAYRYYPSQERTSEYRESLYVGYRYYDTADVPVLYPFGFGLSYTTFEYSGLEVNEEGVSFTITNSGSRDGAEVAQLYVGLPNGKVFRPKKELKGFAKVFLKAGESKKVSIAFDDKTFRYFNVNTNNWEVEDGKYVISVGASSADIRLTGEVLKSETTENIPYRKEELPSYYSGKIQSVETAEYEKLLGRSVPDGKWSGELGLNDAICQMYYAKSSLARFAYNRLTAIKKKADESGKPDLNILFIYNMPFRAMAKMTGGAVSMEMAEGIVKLVNGHFFGGLGQIISGYFKNGKKNKEYEAKIK